MRQVLMISRITVIQLIAPSEERSTAVRAHTSEAIVVEMLTSGRTFCNVSHSGEASVNHNGLTALTS